MHRLEGLAQAAVGFDLKRGDSVVVENVSFGSNLPESGPAGVAKVVDQAKELLHSEPGAARAAMMGFVGLLIVMMVLRPVARQVVAILKEPAALPGSTESRLALLGSDAAEQLAAGKDSFQDEILAGQVASQVVVEKVAEHIRTKPVQSTKLLENWITGPQETS